MRSNDGEVVQRRSLPKSCLLYTSQKGAAGLSACTDRIFRALSEYCLRTDETLTGTVTLTAGPEGVLFRRNDGADQPLFDLLPAAYTGALDAIRAEINELVGLAPVKELSLIHI